MALSATVQPTTRPENHGRVDYPCPIQSDWQTLCDAPDVVESDSGVVETGKVVKPGAIVRAAQRKMRLGGMATKLLVALKYNHDATPNADPVVRIFGRDLAGNWHVLRNSSGSSELTIATAVATDAVDDDGDYRITSPIEVDVEGSYEVIVGVQTAFNVSAGTKTDSAILGKIVSNR